MQKGNKSQKYESKEDQKVLIIPDETPVESLAPSPASSRPVSARTTTTVAPIEDQDPEDPVGSTEDPPQNETVVEDNIEESPTNDDDMEDPPPDDDMGESPPADDDDMD